MPVPYRVAAFDPRGCPPESAWGITRRFHRLSPGTGLVAYALRTRAPLSSPRRGIPVRLACIRPAASVHPEPGSNSSLYYCCTNFFPDLGLRYDSCFLTLRNGSEPRGSPVSDFYAGLKFSKNLTNRFNFTYPLRFDWDCKDTAIFDMRKCFFEKKSKKISIS